MLAHCQPSSPQLRKICAYNYWQTTTTILRRVCSHKGVSVVAIPSIFRSRCYCFSSNTTTGSNHENHPVEEERPMVIVGGGPTGLILAHLLTTYRVPHVLLEAQSVSQRFQHPQAHFLNTRTMEILRSIPPPRKPSIYDSVAGITPYERILDEIRLPMYWKSFRFASTMSTSGRPHLAIVDHRVEIPIQANRDANGMLADDYIGEPELPRADLSPCTVGHLPQHTFGSILYRLLQEERPRLIESASADDQYNVGGIYSDLQYETPVQRVEFCPQTKLWNVHTPQQVYSTDVVIAADGAHSPIREAHNISMIGKRNVQHLVNIHVTIPDLETIEWFHSGDNYAMLYAIFNDSVVAMVVMHDEGEYVIQIPYFPPYQTFEKDFTMDKVNDMIAAIFGIDVQEWKIESCRPWIMHSLVAESYYVPEGIAFVGDAAHVFPPAGGFGMNTGIQDAHNLAWKLASYRHRKYQNEDQQRTFLQQILHSYHTERRPIAQRNAALSMRNYKRLLSVTNAMYIQDQHPKALHKLLETTNFDMATKSQIFKNLYEAALYPLSWLRTERASSFVYKHIQNNLLQALEKGMGLPLLFPKFEIGFSYNHQQPENQSTNVHENQNAEETIKTNTTAAAVESTKSSSNDNANTTTIKAEQQKQQEIAVREEYDWKSDTLPETPFLAVGRLVPHAALTVLAGARHFQNLIYLPTGDDEDGNPIPPSRISTVDLPAQMCRHRHPSINCVLLVVSDAWNFRRRKASLLQLCRDLADQLQMAVELAIIRTDDSSSATLAKEAILILDGWRLEESNSAFDFRSYRNNDTPYAILVRPDSHIAGIVDDLDLPLDTIRDQLCESLEFLLLREEQQDHRPSRPVNPMMADP